MALYSLMKYTCERVPGWPQVPCCFMLSMIFSVLKDILETEIEQTTVHVFSLIFNITTPTTHGYHTCDILPSFCFVFCDVTVAVARTRWIGSSPRWTPRAGRARLRVRRSLRSSAPARAPSTPPDGHHGTTSTEPSPKRPSSSVCATFVSPISSDAPKIKGLCFLFGGERHRTDSPARIH